MLVTVLVTVDADAQSTAQPGETVTVTLPGDVEMAFVKIPAGTFEMGSPSGEKGCDKDESPVHTVRISKPFYLGIYEVTQEQWEAVMGTNPAEYILRPKNPVEKVSWDTCQVFVEKMNALGQGTFRLPTEAEWEYACRAGTKTRFYWGDDPDASAIRDYAWSAQDGIHWPGTVGSKKPNAWGLYDMSGNLWEWCLDRYAAYPSRPQTDPRGPAKGNARVSRGGCWRYEAEYCRSADRYYAMDNVPSYLIGCRLLKIHP